MSIIRCHQQSTVFSISPYIRKPSISVLYSAVLYCTVLYCTVLYCTVLYCTVLYCTVLYCTALYCALGLTGIVWTVL